MNTNNNINNENNENKTFMQKVNGFIKNHKIPTIATACVLVLAIGAGVIFGVTNHNGTTGKFPTFSDSESDKTDLDVPSIEEGDDTSSDDATSSDETDTSEVVSQTPTPNDNKNNTVSKEDTPSTAVSKTETVSKVENTTSNTTSTTTPSTSTPEASTPSTTTWTCPDASVHPEFDAVYCYSETEHNRLIQNHQNWLDRQQNQTDNRSEEERKNNCWICNRPFGDGYNGTCANFFEESTGSYTCHHYD